ncbi:uncharacterized protein LOC115630467 [Scaptodrosophila lebanonensis]|uniref:Uncharacterized protein LOC115630467 n=1 Tax=Drosophila lebanonensis TaxID=7225 RepID=A0A6J2U6V8_DROLE|nr:uncharacterized protein LOC115630467 [Scaptodrosophila lebanonensis]XP_030382897.1 uncharacterized protein LOC115630467 [Scaptodrosophila lebanonensis]
MAPTRKPRVPAQKNRPRQRLRQIPSRPRKNPYLNFQAYFRKKHPNLASEELASKACTVWTSLDKKQRNEFTAKRYKKNVSRKMQLCKLPDPPPKKKEVRTQEEPQGQQIQEMPKLKSPAASQKVLASSRSVQHESKVNTKGSHDTEMIVLRQAASMRFSSHSLHSQESATLAEKVPSSLEQLPNHVAENELIASNERFENFINFLAGQRESSSLDVPSSPIAHQINIFFNGHISINKDAFLNFLQDYQSEHTSQTSLQQIENAEQFWNRLSDKERREYEPQNYVLKWSKVLNNFLNDGTQDRNAASEETQTQIVNADSVADGSCVTLRPRNTHATALSQSKRRSISCAQKPSKRSRRSTSNGYSRRSYSRRAEKRQRRSPDSSRHHQQKDNQPPKRVRRPSVPTTAIGRHRQAPYIVPGKSAYMNFLRKFRDCNPTLSPKEQVRRGAAMWRRMTMHQKNQFRSPSVMTQLQILRYNRSCRQILYSLGAISSIQVRIEEENDKDFCLDTMRGPNCYSYLEQQVQGADGRPSTSLDVRRTRRNWTGASFQQHNPEGSERAPVDYSTNVRRQGTHLALEHQQKNQEPGEKVIAVRSRRRTASRKSRSTVRRVIARKSRTDPRSPLTPSLRDLPLINLANVHDQNMWPQRQTRSKSSSTTGLAANAHMCSINRSSPHSPHTSHTDLRSTSLGPSQNVPRHKLQNWLNYFRIFRRH